MTKQEFLDELRAALYELPPDEREAALQFYDELIDDAGPENEQRVLAELGSPQEVAKQILAGCDARYSPPAYTPQPQVHEPGKRRFAWWWILIGIIGFPAWFPLLVVALVLPFVFLAVAVALFAALLAVAFSLLLVGAVGLVMWIATMGGGMSGLINVPSGIVGLGALLSCLGLGLLLLGPCLWLFTRGVPLIWSKISLIWRRRSK